MTNEIGASTIRRDMRRVKMAEHIFVSSNCNYYFLITNLGNAPTRLWKGFVGLARLVDEPDFGSKASK